jgi:UDP-N-acetylmuramoyl-L-alanyl-D-glutamate--2,6-diaminopimelate ligase
MELDRLAANLPAMLWAGGSLNVQVSHITADSRQVTPGALFVAYRGVGADGHRFIPDALARGAGAVVGELPIDALPVRPPAYIQTADGRAALAWLSAAWHGNPSHAMALVGITGTDGKTTTANLLHSILRAAGRRSGLISTVSAVIGDATHDTGLHTTTPDAPDIQRYLAKMRDADAEVAVLEVTSHGLAQHRVTGCAFDVAVITNITHEHLDAHGAFTAYRDAKAQLFRSLLTSHAKPGLTKTAVLNQDDASFGFLAAIPVARQIVYGIAAAGERQPDGRPLSLSKGGAPPLVLRATGIRHAPAGAEFDLLFSAAHLPPLHLATPLIGGFNVSNILAAAGAATALNISGEAIRVGVQAMRGIPGRMERIHRGHPFTAIVDFAHTPNALTQALTTVRGLLVPGGRLIVLLGSAGLRDREKRRLMGEAAARLADFTVITAEDPRTEDLGTIMAETAAALERAGRQEGQSYVRIADRQRAILFAVQQARPGDLVILCGKGHEQSMCFGTVEHPWRDQDALAWALDALRGIAPPAPPFVLPTWPVQQRPDPPGVCPAMHLPR